MAQLQPYVLRSWEKEFPGIGVQKPGDSQRLYRQSDVEQVLRIKQLVFTEGLTLAGARRRIESSLPPAPAEERRAWYQDNDHLTAKGHAVWGRMIRDELIRRNEHAIGNAAA